MLGTISSGIRAWLDQSQPAPSGIAIWGDGIVDQTLTTLVYGATWESLSADEYVFLLPGLCQVRPSDKDGLTAPSRHLRGALLARIEDVAKRMTPVPASLQNHGREAGILSLWRTGVIASVTADDALESGAEAWRDFYPAGSHRRGRSHTVTDHEDAQRALLWSVELSALRSLDRILSRSLQWERSSQALGASPVSLSEALLASIYASFNAAYVYTEHESSHELLTVGAWLGYLVRGRPALLPLVVAERLIELLDERPGCAARGLDTCDQLLRAHADRAYGAARLLKKARHVCRTSRAALCQPAVRSTPMLVGAPQSLRMKEIKLSS